MDPLSISASIAGLLTITGAIVKTGFKLLNDINDADETIKNLFYEVNSLYGILTSLSNVAEFLEADETATTHYQGRTHLIDACFNTLRKIEISLDNVSAKRNKRVDHMKQRLKWPLKVSETKNLLAEVERHKSAISLATTVDKMYVSYPGSRLSLNHNIDLRIDLRW